METLLDKIAEGDMNWRKVIGDFYNSFKQDVERAESEMEKIEIKDEPAGEDCEVCGSPMVIKWEDMVSLWHVQTFQTVVHKSNCQNDWCHVSKM